MKKLYRGLIAIFILAIAIMPISSTYANNDSRVQVINTNGGGTFTILGGTEDGTTHYDNTHSEFFNLGTSLTLTATPDSYHNFIGWYNCEEYEINQGIMGWRTVGNALTTNNAYTFTVTNNFYNLMPLYEPKMGHNNIWTTDGGEIAVLYEQSENPNHDGQHWGTGEVVDYLKGETITVKARAFDGYRFVGWFITDPLASNPDNYVRDPIVSEGNNYTYQPGVTTIPGVDEPLNYLTAVFELDDREDYSISSGDVIAEFNYDKNYNFTLSFVDILTLSDEEINQMSGGEVTPDMVQQIIKQIKDETKKYGSFIGFYAIEIQDNQAQHGYGGQVRIKIKLTDEMKKYKSFKFIYIDDQDGFKAKETADFTIEGDYIVGTLPHLSAYALVGVNDTANPNTGDNIISYIITLIISIIGFAGTSVYTKKKYD